MGYLPSDFPDLPAAREEEIHLNEEIEQILEQEERRIEEEDRAFGRYGLYVTSPSGMRKIHLESLRALSVGELVERAKRGNYKDLDILKVVFEAYVPMANGYIGKWHFIRQER